MPRSRAALYSLAPALSEEDDATWMITFSDLVLLLLSFLAVGVLAGRGGAGPATARNATLHSTASAERSAPRPAVAPAPPPVAAVPATAPATVAAPVTAAPLIAAVPADPPRARRSPPHLRALAGRLEIRLAAESLVGLAPVILDGIEIVVTIADGGAPWSTPGGIRPVVEPLDPIARPLPELGLGVLDAATTDPERALARVARVVHELAGSDPTLEIRTTGRRVAIRAQGI